MDRRTEFVWFTKKNGEIDERERKKDSQYIYRQVDKFIIFVILNKSVNSELLSMGFFTAQNIYFEH